jgi:hypothetical protein
MAVVGQGALDTRSPRSSPTSVMWDQPVDVPVDRTFFDGAVPVLAE